VSTNLAHELDPNIDSEPLERVVAMSYTCQPEQRWDPRFRLGGYTATWMSTVEGFSHVGHIDLSQIWPRFGLTEL
jgi:hypothetical protein